jgi:hypothetical protein
MFPVFPNPVTRHPSPVGRAACHVRQQAFYAACHVRRLVHRSLGEVGSLLRGIFPPVNRRYFDLGILTTNVPAT